MICVGWGYKKKMVVYYAFLSERWDQSDERLLPFVSAERRKKILKYRFDEDRKLSLYVELLCRMLLSDVSSRHFDSFTFGTTEYGKPIIENSDWQISLSHTRMCVVVCVSKLSEVGIDVEKITVAPMDVTQMCFHPNEIAFIKCGGTSGQNERFYQMWTRKESFLKQLGCGFVEAIAIERTYDIGNRFFTAWTTDGYQFSCCSGVEEKLERKRVSESEIKIFYSI